MSLIGGKMSFCCLVFYNKKFEFYFFLYLGDTQNLFGRFQTIPNLVKISLLEMREGSDSDSQSRTMGQIGMSLYRHWNMEYHDTVSLKTRLFFFF